MPDGDGPVPGIDVRSVRDETPGADRVLHFNNAGASLPPRPVVDACTDHLRREARVGGYEAAAEAEDELASTYEALAGLLGCRPAEMALTSSATRAWDMAFYSLSFSEGDRILTSRASYASNHMAFLQVARRTGCRVEVVDSDEHGQIDVDDLRRRIDGRTALVALTHVPTNGGLVNPAADVGRVASEAGVPYLVDACQSVGQMPVDVDAMGCDLLSATGRKYLRGPRGIGFLYVRGALLERLEPPSSTSGRPPGRPPTASSCATTPAASRSGSAAPRSSSASGPPSGTPRRWTSRRDGAGSGGWPPRSGSVSETCRGWRCGTPAG